MSKIVKLVLWLSLTASFCFGGVYEKEVSKLLTSRLSDPNLIVEVVFDKESAQLLEHISCAMPKMQYLLESYSDSSFKAHCIAEDGTKLPIAGIYKCFKYLPVAAKKIAAGSLINKKQIKVVKLSCFKRHDVALDAAKVVGMEALENILSGNPFPLASLAEPVVINVGDLVDVIVREKSISIRASCIALEPGRLGQQIRLRNPKTNRVLLGIVQDNKSAIFAELP